MDIWALVIAGLGSLATVTLAGVALVQAKRIKDQDKRIDKQGERIEKQIELGNRQAKTAEEQAQSAKDSANSSVGLHREAVRSRVDQGSPEVVVSLEHPQPPQMDHERAGMPRRSEVKLLDPESQQRSRSAVGEDFHEQGGSFLWFHGRGLLLNEGRTSARVRLSQEGRFIEGSSPLAPDEDIEIPVIEDDDGYPRAVLRPGDRALFEWAYGRTVGDWAQAQRDRGSPKGSIWFWITVFDTREMGVVDTQLMHFKPEVLEPVPGRDGLWRVPSSQDFGPVYALPRRRGYRHEGAAHEDLSQRDEHLKYLRSLHPEP